MVGIVAVFLVIGGVVIMNVMLATVIERTHEIGIRKSLGARRADILVQFLAETAVMSTVGGAIGVALAYVFRIDYCGLHACADARPDHCRNRSACSFNRPWACSSGCTRRTKRRT